jgi:toluene monooxygenase system ferredoxin subunit
MGFQSICRKDAVNEGGMGIFQAGQTPVVLLWPTGGELKAYRGRCPHKDVAFDEKTVFDGKTIVCATDQWGFSAASGKCTTSITDHKLEPFALRFKDDEVQVDVGWERPVSRKA